jgi:hypothetical protein
MKMSIQVIARSFSTLIFILYIAGNANAQISVKEISLIKIVIPEKFKTDYAFLVKAGEVYSETMNSETAKALDEAFSGFFAKLDDVTAQSILYLIRDKPEKNALRRLLKERNSYCFWHPLVSADIDEYYTNLKILADSIDEEGMLKHRPDIQPKYPIYDTLSTHLIYLDRKILLEKNIYWSNQPSEFHQLAALEERLSMLPDEIEQATSNVRYFEREYERLKNDHDDPPKPESLINAENKLMQLVAEQNENKTLQKKIFY